MRAIHLAAQSGKKAGDAGHAALNLKSMKYVARMNEMLIFMLQKNSEKKIDYGQSFIKENSWGHQISQKQLIRGFWPRALINYILRLKRSTIFEPIFFPGAFIIPQ